MTLPGSPTIAWPPRPRRRRRDLLTRCARRGHFRAPAAATTRPQLGRRVTSQGPRPGRNTTAVGYRSYFGPGAPSTARRPRLRAAASSNTAPSPSRRAHLSCDEIFTGRADSGHLSRRHSAAPTRASSAPADDDADASRRPRRPCYSRVDPSDSPRRPRRSDRAALTASRRSRRRRRADRSAPTASPHRVDATNGITRPKVDPIHSRATEGSVSTPLDTSTNSKTVSDADVTSR